MSAIFNKGDPVRLTRSALKNIYANSKRWEERRGVVAHEPRTIDGNVSVLWDGYKTPIRYARIFIELNNH